MADDYVRLIPPIDITDSNLNSTNVPETDYDEYDAGTTYNDGDRVIITTGVHRVYLSTTTQTGNYPPDSLTTWIDEGATNAWRMFDASVNSVTSNPDTISFSITPDMLTNSVVLMGLFGQTATVAATSAASGEVYNNTYDLQDFSSVADWYEYFYMEYNTKTALTLTDLPAYSDLTISVTIDNTGGTAQCGVVVLGRQNVIGQAMFGLTTSIIDYSQKTTNDEGVTSVTEGAFSKRADVTVLVENGKYDSVQKMLSKYRATPIIYAVTSLYSSTVVYGYYTDFDLTIPHSVYAECTLTVEGLT
jgi:hypothetical protein